MPKELSPFDKMREATKRVLSVSKEEMEKREERWRKEQEEKKPRTKKPE